MFCSNLNGCLGMSNLNLNFTSFPRGLCWAIVLVPRFVKTHCKYEKKRVFHSPPVARFMISSINIPPPPNRRYACAEVAVYFAMLVKLYAIFQTKWSLMICSKILKCVFDQVVEHVTSGGRMNPPIPPPKQIPIPPPPNPSRRGGMGGGEILFKVNHT